MDDFKHREIKYRGERRELGGRTRRSNSEFRFICLSLFLAPYY